MTNTEAYSLDGAETIDWSEVETLEPAAQRHWRKQWETIVMYINALMRNAPADTFTMICKDGFSADVRFEESGSDIETLTVRVTDPEEAKSLRMLWPDAQNRAVGLFHNVQAADVIELAWTHGGINMAASREATQTQGRRAHEV